MTCGWSNYWSYDITCVSGFTEHKKCKSGTFIKQTSIIRCHFYRNHKLDKIISMYHWFIMPGDLLSNFWHFVGVTQNCAYSFSFLFSTIIVVICIKVTCILPCFLEYCRYPVHFKNVVTNQVNVTRKSHISCLTPFFCFSRMLLFVCPPLF